MAYLGAQPRLGKFQKLDDISSGFNGATNTFNLTVGASGVSPFNAANLLISLNGVIQEPGVAYTIGLTQIIFNEAPLSGETFFGVLL